MTSTDFLNQKFLQVPVYALLISAAFHVMVPVFFMTYNLLDRWGLLPFRKQTVEKQVYQEFIQVDVVALPNELAKDLWKIDATAPVVDKVEQAPEINEDIKAKESEPTMVDPSIAEKAKKAEQEKAKKIKEAEKEKVLKKLQAEAKREAAIKALTEKRGKRGRKTISGNLLSKGTSTTGMIGMSKDQYGSLVLQRIREHFNVFPWQEKKGLVCVIYVELYPTTGRIREKRVVRRSIDPLYDSAVLQAIEESQPFPIPEDPSVIQGGITLEFRPEVG